jgi:hypothetical protein
MSQRKDKGGVWESKERIHTQPHAITRHQDVHGLWDSALKAARQNPLNPTSDLISVNTYYSKARRPRTPLSEVRKREAARVAQRKLRENRQRAKEDAASTAFGIRLPDLALSQSPITSTFFADISARHSKKQQHSQASTLFADISASHSKKQQRPRGHKQATRRFSLITNEFSDVHLPDINRPKARKASLLFSRAVNAANKTALQPYDKMRSKM